MKNRKVDHLRQKINYINSKATNENHLGFINVFAMEFRWKRSGYYASETK